MSASNRKSSRTALLVTASALAFVASAPVLAQANPPQAAAGQQSAPSHANAVKVRSWHTPQGGDVAPAWGDIDAFWGDINPFWGDIDAFWGDIDAFQGSTPYWGDIDAFWGDIDAFEGGNSPYWGDIDAFWGDIDAFWGDIDAFWGDIDAFQNNAQWGDIDAFWGDINPFWGDIDAFWGDIDAFHGGSTSTPAYGMVGYFWHQMGPLWNDTNQKWGALGAYSQGSTSYAQVQDQLGDLVAVSKAMWGPAVTAKTGQSFEAGFADEVLTKHGIDLDDPSTLANMSAGDRAHFFMDWYDGLMAFSGVDRVDHWMAGVKWSPGLTQIQGEGADSVIGLLDMTVVGDPDVSNNITSTGGYSNNLGGHGTGVASLMVAAHDGEGLMGIAPRASVVAYNPFDNSATASWEDVRSGGHRAPQRRRPA
ncbi:S8 family serine peptidase [Phenylobacterium sp. J367]|uniref:S8 family serine peptidase n=1 Tax=Phenylobacterium sp. J367 TaxID=2898435 RepID=UPI0021513B4F|nr:S8 family serine peptidase [Phenylobacterium sp. J367]MCR5877711.1 hypothetical protein [Phenylobacterium sp. J367]